MLHHLRLALVKLVPNNRRHGDGFSVAASPLLQSREVTPSRAAQVIVQESG